MAWTSDSHDASAGKFIDLLDALLVAAHATWTIYDAGMPANEKVYRCYDPAEDPVVDFYLHVQDNQADFAIVLMYDSWDIGTHSYAKDTGCKIIYGAAALNVPYICKKNAGYYFSSHDHRFIYIDKFEWEANYVGMLEWPGVSKPFIQHPIIIANSTTYAGGYNPLGRPWNSAALTVGMAMIGARGQGMAPIKTAGYQYAYRYIMCADGGLHVRPHWVFDAAPYYLLLGRLRSVLVLYRDDFYINDDTLTIGGAIWRYVEGTDSTRYACFIKQE